MRLANNICRTGVAAIMICFAATGVRGSENTLTALENTIRTLENTLDARIGVYVQNVESGWTWGHRETERFLMASTFKTPLCGAVLDRLAQTEAALDDLIPIAQSDILSYAPVTKDHVGGELSLADLCEATLDQSDNTAANLLIHWLGGPSEVTQFLRKTGDAVTRLDRLEPDVNSFVPGDPRDTTSPHAMVQTWIAMLIGEALPPNSSKQLAEWMQMGSVTGTLLRPSVPAGWRVSDKSGGGRHHTRNLVAMVTPPDRSPYFIAIFVSDTPASWDTRNRAVAQIGAAIIEVIKSR